MDDNYDFRVAAVRVTQIALKIYEYLRIFWRKKRNVISKKGRGGGGGGGGVKAVWKFSTKTSIFGETDVRNQTKTIQINKLIIHW